MGIEVGGSLFLSVFFLGKGRAESGALRDSWDRRGDEDTGGCSYFLLFL